MSESFNDNMLLHNFLDTPAVQPTDSKLPLEQPKPKPNALPFAFLARRGSGGVGLGGESTSSQYSEGLAPETPRTAYTPLGPPSATPRLVDPDAKAIEELWAVSQRFATRSLCHWDTIFGEKTATTLRYFGSTTDNRVEEPGEGKLLHELWNATWTFLQVSYEFYDTRSKVALVASTVDFLIQQCRSVGQFAVQLIMENAKLSPDLDFTFLKDSWQLCDHLYMSGGHSSQTPSSFNSSGNTQQLNTLELYVKLTSTLFKSTNFGRTMDLFISTLSKEEAQLKKHAKSLILASWQVAELLVEYPRSVDPDRILDSVWMLSADLKATVHHQTFHLNWCHSNAMKLASNLGDEATAFVRAAKRSYRDLETVEIAPPRPVSAAATLTPPKKNSTTPPTASPAVPNEAPAPSVDDNGKESQGLNITMSPKASAIVPATPVLSGAARPPMMPELRTGIFRTAPPPPSSKPALLPALPSLPINVPSVISRDASGKKSVLGLFGVVAEQSRPNPADRVPTFPKSVPSVAGPGSTVDDQPVNVTCSISDLTTLYDLRLRILIIYALTRCGFKASILISGRPHLKTFAQKLPKNCLGEGQMLLDAATLFRNSVLDPNNIVSRGDRACLEASAEDVAKAVIWKMQGGRWSWLGELFKIVVSCTVYETERMRGKMLTIY